MGKKLSLTSEPSEISKVLRELLSRSSMTSTELARHTALPASTISTLLSGSANPRASTLKPIAKFFNVSIGQLLGEETLSNKTGEYSPTNRSSWSQIPVISWSDIETLRFKLDSMHLHNHQEWVLTEENVSSKAFALISLKSHEPFIKQGSTIIVDPETTIHNGDQVLVGQTGEIPNIREAVIDMGTFFKSLSSDVPMVKMSDALNIYGVIVEIKFSLKRN